MTHALTPAAGTVPLSAVELTPNHPEAVPLTAVRLGPVEAPSVTLTAPADGVTLYIGQAAVCSATVDTGVSGTCTECNFELGGAPILAAEGADAGGGVWSGSYTPLAWHAGATTMRARARNSRGRYGYSAAVDVTVSEKTALQRLAELCDGICLYVGDASATYMRVDAGNGQAGDQIDRWWDQSGSAHAVQDTDTLQPTIETNVAWDLPVLLFQGGDTMTSGFSLNRRTALTQYVVFGGVAGTNGGQLSNSPTYSGYWSTFFNRVTDTNWQIGASAGRWDGYGYQTIGGYFAFAADIRPVTQVHCLCSIFNGGASTKETRLRLEWDTAPKTVTWVTSGAPPYTDTGAGSMRVGAGSMRPRLVAMAASVHTDEERAEVYALLRILCPDWTA